MEPRFYADQHHVNLIIRMLFPIQATASQLINCLCSPVSSVGACSAGATVALINIPLSISLAVAAQSNPTAGIITAVWAGLIGAIAGGSDYNITGPTGALAGILTNYVLLFGVDCLPLLSITSSVLIFVVFLLKWDRYVVRTASIITKAA